VVSVCQPASLSFLSVSNNPISSSERTVRC
jgi:hypothetical protein